MFSASVRLLALLWPFFKESMLKDGSLKDWLRRNRNATIMIIFQIMMLLVCFYLVEMIGLLRKSGTASADGLEKLQTEHAAVVEENAQWKNDLEEERQTSNRMRVYLMQLCTTTPAACTFLIDETERREHFKPETKAEDKASEQWCKLVQESDFTDTRIRQRWLRQCDMEVEIQDSPEIEETPASKGMPRIP